MEAAASLYSSCVRYLHVDGEKVVLGSLKTPLFRKVHIAADGKCVLIICRMRLQMHLVSPDLQCFLVFLIKMPDYFQCTP